MITCVSFFINSLRHVGGKSLRWSHTLQTLIAVELLCESMPSCAESLAEVFRACSDRITDMTAACRQERQPDASELVAQQSFAIKLL